MTQIDDSAQQSNLISREQLFVVREYFKPQLLNLNLSEEQIRNQTVIELNNSLVEVNDCIARHTEFGTVDLHITEFGEYTIANGEEIHQQVGILRVLIDCRSLIQEEIRRYEAQSRLKVVEQQLSESDSAERRMYLTAEKATIHDEMSSFMDSSTESEEDLFPLNPISRARLTEEKQRVEIEQLRQQMQLERQEAESKITEQRNMSRVNFIQGLLNKDMIATLVGAIILIIMSLSLLGAMFFGIEASDIITNTFLIILGFFFGQNANQMTSSLESTQPSDLTNYNSMVNLKDVGQKDNG